MRMASEQAGPSEEKRRARWNERASLSQSSAVDDGDEKAEEIIRSLDEVRNHTLGPQFFHSNVRSMSLVAASLPVCAASRSETLYGP